MCHITDIGRKGGWYNEKTKGRQREFVWKSASYAFPLSTYQLTCHHVFLTCTFALENEKTKVKKKTMVHYFRNIYSFQLLLLLLLLSLFHFSNDCTIYLVFFYLFIIVCALYFVRALSLQSSSHDNGFSPTYTHTKIETYIQWVNNIASNRQYYLFEWEIYLSPTEQCTKTNFFSIII